MKNENCNVLRARTNAKRQCDVGNVIWWKSPVLKRKRNKTKTNFQFSEYEMDEYWILNRAVAAKQGYNGNAFVLSKDFI